MISIEPYAEIELHGKHVVRIYDHSTVYFGDYCRVKLEVRCEIPLPQPVGCSGKQSEYALYSRVLEKMAVPTAAVEETKRLLVDEFQRTSLPYLATAEFPDRLIAREAARQSGVKKRYAARAE